MATFSRRRRGVLRVVLSGATPKSAPERLLKLLGEPELLAGLRYGLAALGVGLLTAVVWRRRGPTPVVGLLLAAATLLGLDATGRLPSGLAVGIALLGVAGLIADLSRLPAWSCGLLAVPGAWVVAAEGGLGTQPAARVAAGLAICIGGAFVADFDRRWRTRGYSVMLLVVSILGVLSTVPDTERALVLAGAAFPLVFLVWPVPLGALGAGGSLAATGVAAWVVALDGAGRQGSIVGAAGCIGLLLVEPMVRAMRGGGSPLDWVERWAGRVWLAGPWVALVHLPLVILAARVAGLRRTVGQALPIVLVAFVLALGLAFWLSPRSSSS